MKTIVKLGIVGIALLVALSACDLFQQINVQWTINGYGVSGTTATVNYTAYNQGRFDLTGVNLEVAVLVAPGVYISAWTPDFSLSQGAYYTNSISFSIAPYSAASQPTVLGVDMDKP